MTSSYPLPSIAGFDTGLTWATASEYFKYVSIDATTTRASTVIRSIPTSETRTHASMTIPLSSTRSRTSIRLVPPAARSTAMKAPLSRVSLFADRAVSAAPAGGSRQRCDLPFEQSQLLAEIEVFLQYLFTSGRQVTVVLPPVEPD